MFPENLENLIFEHFEPVLRVFGRVSLGEKETENDNGERYIFYFILLRKFRILHVCLSVRHST